MKIIPTYRSTVKLSTAQLGSFKERLKDALAAAAKQKLQKDPFKKIKDPQKVKFEEVKEWTIQFNEKTGHDRTLIALRNLDLNTGDYFFRSPKRAGIGTGQGDPDTTEIELTIEEFYAYAFSELNLPNLTKYSEFSLDEVNRIRGGTGLSGPITRINYTKTMEVALGRKFSAHANATLPDRHVPFLTEEDLRFNILVDRPKRVQKAVLIMINDMSGSVDPETLSLSVTYHSALYYCLSKLYPNLEVRCIRFSGAAHECTEREFLSPRQVTGSWTNYPAALKLAADLIKESYPSGEENIYCTLLSDGEIDRMLEKETVGLFRQELMPKLQFFAYAQYAGKSVESRSYELPTGVENLLRIHCESLIREGKLGVTKLLDKFDIMVALRHLFGK